MYVVIMVSTVVVVLIFMMHDYHRCIAATAACAAHVAVPQSHPDLLQRPAAVIWQDGGVRAQPGGTAADVHKVRRPYPICTHRYTLFNFLHLVNVPRTRLHLACWALYWTRTGVAHAAAEPISALLCHSHWPVAVAAAAPNMVSAIGRPVVVPCEPSVAMTLECCAVLLLCLCACSSPVRPSTASFSTVFETLKEVAVNAHQPLKQELAER